MNSTLGWVEISSSALRDLRRELDDESQGVVDEMGVGALHVGYADKFFPGTSVLQKRPRYLFFTCWNYLCLDDDTSVPARERKERAEEWVRDQLHNADQKNVIGERVKRPAQPVDFIYWTALNKWGFYRGPDRSTLLHRFDAIRPERATETPVDDSEHVVERSAALFVVKEPPRFWLRPRPREPLTFDLALDEAAFLQQRLLALSPCVLSEAASLARQGSPRGDAIWNDALIESAAERRRQESSLRRSKYASSLAHVIRAVYAALVEQRRNDTAKIAQFEKSDTYYQDLLFDLLAHPAAPLSDVRQIDLQALSADLPRLDPRLLSLMTHVVERVKGIRTRAHIQSGLLDLGTARLFEHEEVRRKGPQRARLPLTPLGAARRAGFNKKTVTVGGIDYRWQTVRMLLRDLHEGLRR